jgi:hypothetical protein
LLPHQKRGLYCHSGLPDDLGIQYQSYSKENVVGEDEHIALLPGLGHTGSVPFDENHGWYRSWRGLAGSVAYKARRKGWTPFQHAIFPEELKDAVRTLLLCNNRIEEDIEGAACIPAAGDLLPIDGKRTLEHNDRNVATALFVTEHWIVFSVYFVCMQNAERIVLVIGLAASSLTSYFLVLVVSI